MGDEGRKRERTRHSRLESKQSASEKLSERVKASEWKERRREGESFDRVDEEVVDSLPFTSNERTSPIL